MFEQQEVSGNHKVIIGHRLGTIIALAYLGSALAGTGWPALDGTFSPDTSGYLDFSPYRQPMYGLWANTIFALTGSFRAVQLLQTGLFIGLGLWVIIELSLISDIAGPAAAAILAAALAALNRFGLIELAGSLNSEGLFYPMILAMVALFLWWLRTRQTGILAALAFLVVAMTQLRTAVMLLPIVPLAIAVYILVTRSLRQGSDRPAIAILGGLVAGVLVLPPMLGKNFLQYSTVRDSTGFALLPRVSLLPVTEIVAERSPDWAAMASSWRTAAASLDAVALTQFDAQLQEAIRFDLGPKVLLPALLNLSPDETTVGWQNGTYYRDARRIAIDWISREWPTYLRISGYHLWGMLTIANFMDSADRMKVWAALNEVSPSTWGNKPMRTDYPLNQINKPLKCSTELIYRAIRYACITTLFLGLMSAIIVLMQSIYDRIVSPGYLAVALAVGWCIAHSIPAGMLVFPEFRYTYANLIVLISGAATWLAYVRGTLRRLSYQCQSNSSG
jgi:hypothetical protein